MTGTIHIRRPNDEMISIYRRLRELGVDTYMSSRMRFWSKNKIETYLENEGLDSLDMDISPIYHDKDKIKSRESEEGQ